LTLAERSLLSELLYPQTYLFGLAFTLTLQDSVIELSKHALQGISPVHFTLLNRQFSHAFDVRFRGVVPAGDPETIGSGEGPDIDGIVGDEEVV
jgi:hypothetical protein